MLSGVSVNMVECMAKDQYARTIFMAQEKRCPAAACRSVHKFADCRSCVECARTNL